ncbi:MAG: EamA family transporter [Rhodospirillales bacterium]|nr:EamA family transporter [Rhodospirillales bacterium]
MTVDLVLLVLCAAALNASWNALVKVSGDRIAVMAIIALAGAVLSFVLVPFVGFPDPACWPFLIAAIVLHTAYHFMLPIAYNYGDLGQVYPIARGSAPLLVTAAAFVFAGETLGFIPLLGVICLAVGVMALSFDQGTGITKNPRSVLFALATGVCIASYTMVDGLGARQTSSAMSFAVWLTIGDGLLTFLIALPWKRRAIVSVARSGLVLPGIAAVMQVGAYWIAVWALAHAPLGMVSALRETSVLFAAAISVLILKEGLGVWRFISAALVVCGIALTRIKQN